MYPGRLLRFSRRLYGKFHPNIKDRLNKSDYFGNPILSLEAGNAILYQKILEGKPFMATRFGHTELSVLCNYFEIEKLKSMNPLRRFWEETKFMDAEWSDHKRYAIHFSSGFFPATPENLNRFCSIYFESIPKIDMLGVWYNYFEDEIVHRFCPASTLVPLQSLEPYYFPDPWSIALQGKQVLVIHPFEESIIKQYAIREKLFPSPDILPQFSLQTLRPPQAVAHNPTTYSSWFEGLEHMQQEISNRQFDIALIGAGAYGLPLAAYIKQLGKQAVHVGGALQIFFGIMGRRWDSLPEVSRFYNNYWTRPLPEETPEKFMEFEGGKGYW